MMNVTNTTLAPKNLTVSQPGPGKLKLHDLALDKACISIEVFGFVLAGVLLLLSCIPHKTGFSLFVRIFTVNATVINVLHLIASFVIDIIRINRVSLDAMSPFVLSLSTNAYQVQSITMVAFSGSFTPLIVIALVASYWPNRLASTGCLIIFVDAVIIADLVPIILQVVHVSLPTTSQVSTGYAYMALVCCLYLVQCVIVYKTFRIWLKTHRYVYKRWQVTEAIINRKKLSRVLLFAVAPLIVHLPFVVYVIVKQASFANIASIHARADGFHDAMRVIFAIKPTIDALSIIAFVGDYRRHVIDVYDAVVRRIAKLMPRLFRKHILKQRTSTVRTVASTFDQRAGDRRHAAPFSSIVGR
ncbi:hypothetical protein AAVH_14560 [Aphelenchoides avenae]|nr:hypothetical protein AAVH_14560 [Aphelenchus avenae]